jgi:hypothetical protein
MTYEIILIESFFVSADALPEPIKFRGKSTDELEELVNQEWDVLVSDYSDDDHDDYYPTGAGMYF